MSCCEAGTCPCNPASETERLAELERKVEVLEAQLGPALQLFLDIKHGEDYGADASA